MINHPALHAVCTFKSRNYNIIQMWDGALPWMVLKKQCAQVEDIMSRHNGLLQNWSLPIYKVRFFRSKLKVLVHIHPSYKNTSSYTIIGVWVHDSSYVYDYAFRHTHITMSVCLSSVYLSVSLSCCLLLCLSLSKIRPHCLFYVMYICIQSIIAVYWHFHNACMALVCLGVSGLIQPSNESVSVTIYPKMP